jgi:hypothetical protein
MRKDAACAGDASATIRLNAHNIVNWGAANGNRVPRNVIGDGTFYDLNGVDYALDTNWKNIELAFMLTGAEANNFLALHIYSTSTSKCVFDVADVELYPLVNTDKQFDGFVYGNYAIHSYKDTSATDGKLSFKVATAPFDRDTVNGDLKDLWLVVADYDAAGTKLISSQLFLVEMDDFMNVTATGVMKAGDCTNRKIFLFEKGTIKPVMLPKN